MGKILKLFAGILCWGLLSAVIAVLIAYLIDGKEALDVVSNNVDATKLADSVALTCVLTFVAFILQIMLHEVGHMIGGLATGYKFYSIRPPPQTAADRGCLSVYPLPGRLRSISGLWG